MRGVIAIHPSHHARNPNPWSAGQYLNQSVPGRRMSRPPNTPDQLSSAYNNRGGLIDFVNVPVTLSNQAYGMPYSSDMEAFHPSIYAQAGFPGYVPNQVGQLGAQVYQQVPIASPAYLPTLSSVPVHELGAPMAAPVESEQSMRQRINEKIDDIIRTQKDNMLNSKIESLSNKVEQLSHNLSYQSLSQEATDRANPAHIHRLSDKVDKLSQSLEMANEQRRLQSNFQSNFNHGEMDKLGSSLGSSYPVKYEPLGSHISAESDAEISRRLRRLASESAMRQNAVDRHERLGTKIPDW
jgi:hypothetical protein